MKNILSINEYLQSENDRYLFKYLNISDKEKYNDILYTMSHYIDDFIEFKDPSYDNNTNEIIEKIKQEGEGYNYVEQIKSDEFKYDFYEYMRNMFHRSDVNQSEFPSYMFFDYTERIKEQWLIHLTSDAYGISENGFTEGVDDMSRLGLTLHLSDHEKSYGGYNFAFTVNDFKKYGTDMKYGDQAVIFRSSGIRAWHHGDEEYQVIFTGSNAKNIIPVTYEDEGYEIISKKTDNVIAVKESLSELVDWVEQNHFQYRKHL